MNKNFPPVISVEFPFELTANSNFLRKDLTSLVRAMIFKTIRNTFLRKNELCWSIIKMKITLKFRHTLNVLTVNRLQQMLQFVVQLGVVCCREIDETFEHFAWWSHPRRSGQRVKSRTFRHDLTAGDGRHSQTAGGEFQRQLPDLPPQLEGFPVCDGARRLKQNNAKGSFPSNPPKDVPSTHPAGCYADLLPEAACSGNPSFLRTLTKQKREPVSMRRIRTGTRIKNTLTTAKFDFYWLKENERH